MIVECIKIDYNELCFAIDLPTPDKDLWKKYGHSTKSSEILFFPDQE